MKKVIKFDEKEIKLKKICVDTSAIINGRVTELIKSGKLKNSEIIIPEFVMGELQAQAAKGRETGYIGLEEIKKIREEANKHKTIVKFFGERQSYEDILLAKSGRIDALIADMAKKNDAVLLTTDLLQALVAEAKGLKLSILNLGKKQRK